MKRLLDMADKQARAEMGNYVIVSQSRMDNILHCLSDGARQIAELSRIIAEQQKTIESLSLELLAEVKP